MEFPDLGEHCSETFCRQIDFLPVKCDACQNIFCNDHFTYASHGCPSAYKKDIQVPVCPLCSKPVPISRGESPDVAVSAHIDNDCASDPAVHKRKIYTNRCNKRGCKKKELVKVTCDSCLLNFCLAHRHASDHDCLGAGGRPAATRAGLAALQRLQTARHGAAPSAAAPAWRHGAGTSADSRALQGHLSEDEALARALQASLALTPPAASAAAGHSQQELDRQLAEALQASEAESAAARRRQRNNTGSCGVS